jgi:PPK2 family polyphosphate:nucleotide phosphotransferase
MDYQRFMVPPQRPLGLDVFDPADRCGFGGKHEAEQKLKDDIRELESLQSVLAAQTRYGVLIVFQGMDTAGKDGAVKHVMSGVNPAGVDVYPFKAPSEEEKRHDFLWRSSKVLPERGRIAIFNRSYYEDVVVTRVHPEFLGPFESAASTESFWENRFDAIRSFEKHLTNEGTVILKFFLHLSKEEQARRLKARMDDPEKQWKVSLGDLAERTHWDDYMRAYERALEATSSQEAPWYVIPADEKFVAHVVIAGAIVKRLRALDLHYPALAPEIAAKLKEAGAAALQ